jgi:TRAP-type mannitol/chloroaromatic compound transport system permease large subunit
VTVSLGGYPRGYITEPQQSSFRPAARPRIYPWVYSWTYPRAHPWTRCDSNCFRWGPGGATRLNAGGLRPRKPQSLHAPGVLLGLAFLLMNYYYFSEYDFAYSAKSCAWREKSLVVRHSLIALIGPIIILGGIVTGVTTPTESGAVAVAYAALAGLLATKGLT